jgi:hypothetical protein
MTPIPAIVGYDHVDTFTDNPSRYMNALLAFIDQQIGHPV